MNSKRKPRFLCDADGIVADFVKAAIKVMTNLSGKTILEDHIINWEVTEILEDPAHREAAKTEFNKAGFCSAFETYDGAQDAVRTLDRVTEFHFVTAPMIKNPGWMNERMEWLVKHFEIPATRVNFISEKHITSGDFLLDDSERNIQAWSQEYPDGIPIIWDRPWNRVTLDSRVMRVRSWQEVFNVVNCKYPELSILP